MGIKMPYKVAGSLTIVRAGAMVGADKQGVNNSLRKMLEQKARLSGEHHAVVPLKVEMTAPERTALGFYPAPGRSIMLVACLSDAETPLEEERARWRLPKKFQKSARFEYMACAWPSQKLDNGTSGIGLVIKLASGGSISVEMLLEAASELGDCLGGLRHFYVGGEPPLVLERISS